MPAFTQLSNFTPEQQQAFKYMGQNIDPNSYLAKLAGGDQSQFEQMEAPAMRQFQELQGQLGSRFSGGGGGRSLSARHGSGFQNTMNQATSDFAQALQANRLALRQQAIQSLHGMTNDFLNQRPFQYVEKQKRSGGGLGGFFGGMLGPLAGGIGTALGGPIGGMIGSGIGSLFNSSGNS